MPSLSWIVAVGTRHITRSRREVVKVHLVLPGERGEDERLRRCRLRRNEGGFEREPPPLHGTGDLDVPIPILQSASGAAGSSEAPAAAEDIDMSFTFYPSPPRDTDAGVNIWRYPCWGHALQTCPGSEKPLVVADPFIPDARAAYMPEVLQGYPSHEQLLTISMVG